MRIREPIIASVSTVVLAFGLAPLLPWPLAALVAVAVSVSLGRLVSRLSPGEEFPGALPLASVSHEIRTPLNGILGMTQLLLSGKPSSQQREYLEAIRFSGQGLLRLINDMLDYSQIRLETLRLEPETFILRTWVRETVKSVAPQAHLAGLDIAFWIEPDVPDDLMGDPNRMRQVLTNLMVNAIKFTPEGEVLVEVSLQRVEDGHACLRFAVSDTGVGIEPERQGEIFDAFERGRMPPDVSSTLHEHGGVGLGLAISKEIAQRMDGDLTVESAPGLGSTFLFTARFEIRSASDSRREAVDFAEGFDVLVIDDNPTSRRLTERQLRDWGFPVVATNGGLSDIVTATRERSFSLAIVDSKVPGADAFELAGVIGLDNATPGILLSLSHEHIDNEQLRAHGFMGHLTKPAAPEHLLRAIEIVRRGVAVERPEDVQTSHMDRLAIGGLRVLLAEDNPVNRTIVEQMLSRAGSLVTAVDNGRSALELWKKETFDVGLLDVQMPEMDGLTLARTIRELEASRGGHFPLIAVTAHAGEVDRDRCRGAGIDAFLSKPFQERELVSAMRGCLSGDPDGPVMTDPEVRETPFDHERALTRADGDAALLAELATLFLDEMPDTVAQIRDAITARDPKQVERFAHRLKGSLLTLAADPAAAVAHELETGGRERSHAESKELFDRLEHELTRLETRLSSLSSGLRTR